MSEETDGIRWMLVEALNIMDNKGRRNAEGNSITLWKKDWQTLRQRIFTALELAEPDQRRGT